MRFISFLILTVMLMFSVSFSLFAVQTQTGKGGFVDGSMSTTENGVSIGRVVFTDVDPSYGPVLVKVKVTASKSVAGYRIYCNDVLVAERNTYKSFVFEFFASLDSPVTYLEVVPMESHVPFTKKKNIVMNIMSLRQPLVTADRVLKVGRRSFKTYLLNNYPYLTQPAVFSYAIEDGIHDQVMDVLKNAVLFNGWEDSSRLSISLPPGPVYTDFGALLTIDKQKLVYHPASWEDVTDSQLKVGILDSGTFYLNQSDGGSSAIQLHVCWGRKYARGMNMDCPFSYVESYLTDEVDSTAVYPESPKFYAYVLQYVNPDKNPWFRPWKEGQNTHLFQLGPMSEWTNAQHFTITKLSRPVKKPSVLLKCKATMRLYNPLLMKKMRKAGYFFMDSGIHDESVQVNTTAMVVGCHVSEFGKLKGKKVSFPAYVGIYAKPAIDSIIHCVRADTGDSVLYITGNAFANKHDVYLEYQSPGEIPVKTCKLPLLLASKNKPIELIADDGRTFYVPVSVQPGDGGILVVKYPKIIPPAEVNPLTGKPRYDLILQTINAVNGRRNIDM